MEGGVNSRITYDITYIQESGSIRTLRLRTISLTAKISSSPPSSILTTHINPPPYPLNSSTPIRGPLITRPQKKPKRQPSPSSPQKSNTLPISLHNRILPTSTHQRP